MQWKKHRFTVWIANGYRIAETTDVDYPFKLETDTTAPEVIGLFGTLEQAKTHADTLNQLAIAKAENERLRAELARIRDGGTWEAHPTPDEDPWPDEAEAARGISKTPLAIAQ